MKRLVLLFSLVLLHGQAFADVEDSITFDGGFFFSQFKDPMGHEHSTAAGPFLEHTYLAAGDDFKAFHPFWSKLEQHDRSHKVPREITDVLWPLMTRRHFEDTVYTRFGIFFSWDFDEQNARSRDRNWLLPIYFQGTDKEGESYFAPFPLGGSIHEFLGRDRIRFALFPLWLEHSINEVETRTLLWPIFSRTTGDGIERHRVFPLYARSTKDGVYSKRSIMWPFWTDVQYHGEGEVGGGFIFFPFFGRINQEAQHTTWVVPPFFRVTRGAQRNLAYLPWPFIQRITGDQDKFYIWPLWGRKSMGAVDSSFLLWPIFRQVDVRTPNVERRIRTVTPFYISDVQRIHPEEETGKESYEVRRYHKIWPFMDYRRENDASTFRMLSLWPRRHDEPVERNWAPLWTLYSHKRLKEDRQSSLLWGLYKHRRMGDDYRYFSVFPLYDRTRDDRDIDTKSWSILKGLVGYSRKGVHKQFRLLYFLRFGDEEADPL